MGQGGRNVKWGSLIIALIAFGALYVFLTSNDHKSPPPAPTPVATEAPASGSTLAAAGSPTRRPLSDAESEWLRGWLRQQSDITRQVAFCRRSAPTYLAYVNSPPNPPYTVQQNTTNNEASAFIGDETLTEGWLDAAENPLIPVPPRMHKLNGISWINELIYYARASRRGIRH